MFDPGSVTVALGVASSAMSQIKKFYDHGKDLSSMSAEIGEWMSASSEIDEIEKGAKNPTLFRKPSCMYSHSHYTLQRTSEEEGSLPSMPEHLQG